MTLKRLTILAGSLAYLYLWRLGRGVRSLVGGGDPGTCIVVYYHEVRPEHRDLFARQLDILLRVAEPTRADRTDQLKEGVHYAAVTFDDGFQSVIDNAMPELEKRRIPATLFIVTEALGKYPGWLTGTNHRAKLQKVVSVDQLKQMDPEVMALGSHTMTHQRLTRLSKADAKREISQSREQLGRILNREVSLFSFPFGAFNQSLIELCRESGYSRVFSISPLLARLGQREFVTGRVSVEPTDWPIEFRLKILGAYQWLAGVRSLKARLRSVLLSGASPRRPSNVSEAH